MAVPTMLNFPLWDKTDLLLQIQMMLNNVTDFGCYRQKDGELTKTLWQPLETRGPTHAHRCHVFSERTRLVMGLMSDLNCRFLNKDDQ